MVINLFKIINSQNQPAYIYSTKSSNDELKFKYYILSSNSNGTPSIFDIGNILSILQKYNIKMQRINTNSIEFKEFLAEKSLAEEMSKSTELKKNDLMLLLEKK